MTTMKESLSLATRGGLQTAFPIFKACEFVEESLVERSVEHLWYVVEDSCTGLEIIDADSEEWFHSRTPLKVLCMFGDPKLPVCWEV